MASEMLGDITEIFCSCALDLAGLKEGRDYLKHKKIAGGTIDSDIVIGTEADPEIVVLVTNSSSSKNSLEKFWRNMGEVLEGAKILNSPPKIVEINLEGEFRKALSEGMSVIADEKISIADLKNGQKLVSRFRELSNTKLPAGDSRVEAVQNLIKNDATARDLAAQLSGKILNLRKSKADPKLRAIKSALDKLPNGVTIGRKDTFLRRGIAKIALLHLSHPDQIKGKNSDWTWQGTVPRYASILGIIGPGCAGPRFIDKDVIWCLKHVGLSESLSLATRSINDRTKNWESWHAQISNELICEDHDFLVKNFSKASKKESLLKLLCDQNRNGYKWLFAHIMETIKSSTGKKQGYGYSALARDVGYSKGISSGYLILSDWVNGHANLAEDDQLLSDVAAALAKRLAAVGLEKTKKIGEIIEVEYFSNLLEQKIICYWLFEPLRMLIEDSLKRFKVPFKLVKKNPTFIGESLGDSLGIAAPTAIIAKNTLVYWNSAYDKGRHHKTKELMGRGFALRISSDGKSYCVRKEIKKAILLIDGTWEQKQINSLSRCGWDEIFYPDELDQLAKAIV